MEPHHAFGHFRTSHPAVLPFRGSVTRWRSVISNAERRRFSGKPIKGLRNTIEPEQHILLAVECSTTGAQMKQPELDQRHRDKNGEISKKHGNALIGTLRKQYGAMFAKGCTDQERTRRRAPQTR